MVRDFETYSKWSEFHKELQLKEFEKEKQLAFEIVDRQENEQACQAQLRKARKMRFQFDKEGLVNYGSCTKLNKPVSFIPDICQIETQECFEHRRK